MLWRAAFLCVLLLLPAAPTLAHVQVNACGRYSIWIPDTWKITATNEKLTAESRDGELYLVVSPVEDKSADLIDDDVTEFVENELESVSVTSDRREKFAGLDARVIEGTGVDDGDRSFKAVALDPSENEGLIEVLVYGSPRVMKRPANRSIVDRILHSFKPPLAVADALTNACGKYAVWVPETWRFTIENEKLTADSRDNRLHLVVTPLKDKSAALLDDDVADFIDNEFDDMKITADRRERQGSVEARVMEGTGMASRFDVLFRAIALKPRENAAILEMLVYGSRGAMGLTESRAILDRILRSFKPI
ncbi:MAG TPA: hypothetical protein VKW08_08215 [Xanthobacteraceae bacterium]|nr:hypothetical protein [Xanthobacteraceae bacterium]